MFQRMRAKAKQMVENGVHYALVGPAILAVVVAIKALFLGGW